MTPITLLTERERELLALLPTAASNREIAQQLHIAEGTVERTLSTIYQKLGARHRTEAVYRGMLYGLITCPVCGEHRRCA
jgi:DNA-binding NarL/FixJ family response regulator